jgi:hypothetical protein
MQPTPYLLYLLTANTRKSPKKRHLLTAQHRQEMPIFWTLFLPFIYCVYLTTLRVIKVPKAVT